jgi:lambda family phage portal protein
MFAALSRMFSRSAPAAPAVRSSLDAGGGGRRWSDDRTAPSPGVIYHEASRIGARAAHFRLNDPRGARIVETLMSNVAGTGIKPRSEHPSSTVCAQLHTRWKSWGDRADFLGRGDIYQLQCNAVCDMVVYGEALYVFETDPVTAAPQLRRLHPEQLVWDRTFRLPSGGWVQNGVEHDAFGRITAYWIRPHIPGETTVAVLTLAPVRVPATEVIHIFRQLMPGQSRGLSWFAPILLNAKDLDALLDAMLVRAKVAAMHVGVITSADGAVSYDGGAQDGGSLDISLEPGSMPVLPPGRTVEFMDMPSQDNASSLLTEALRSIAVGVGITYEQLSGDYSKVNYSSERSAKLEFRRFIEGIQHHTMVFGFCRPVWNRFIRWQVLTGSISATAYAADPISFEAVKWLPPAWPWVDPKNEAVAAEVALRNRLRSRSEIIAERGYDAEDVDAEIAADAARLKALGIPDVIAPAPNDGAAA